MALSNLHPTPTDTCPLYLNFAHVAALPTKCSRHNTPSRGHAMSKLVKSLTLGTNQYFVVGRWRFVFIPNFFLATESSPHFIVAQVVQYLYLVPGFRWYAKEAKYSLLRVQWRKPFHYTHESLEDLRRLQSR